MSLAEEMLATMPLSDDSSTYSADEEPHIVINESRQAIVPNELKTIAVTGDKDIETVTFDCVRYWDGNDLSTFAIYLNYVLPDLTTGTYIPEKITTTDGDEFYHFDWQIKNNITVKSGKISFAVTAVKTKQNENGETFVDKQWSSLPNGDCSIALGIDISNVPSEEESSAVLAQMSAILEQIQADFDEWLKNNLLISQTTGDSETAVMSQKATTRLNKALGLNPAIGDVNNLPTGMITFTSTTVPAGLPEWDYGGANMLITSRQKEDTLTSFDAQFLRAGALVAWRVYAEAWASTSGVAGWREWNDVSDIKSLGLIESDIEPDNLPSGIITFTSANVPSGLPNIDYGGSCLIITSRKKPNAITPFDSQYLISDRNQYWRVGTWDATGWGEWHKVNFGIGGEGSVIHIGTNGDFTSFKTGIEYAYAHPNTTVYLDEGSYDIVAEYGGELSGIGLMIGNGTHLIGSPKAKVVCNYKGNNANVQELFSVLNAGDGDFTIEGLNIECSNIRYCVHDELIGAEGHRTHRYINCNMSMDNSQSPYLGNFTQCIGGGLGKECTIEVDGGVYHTASDVTRIGTISFHNAYNQGAKSTITIKNVYFRGEASGVRFGWFGASTEVTPCVVTNCSAAYAPIMRAENDTAVNVNMELIAWNNEVRS